MTKNSQIHNELIDKLKTLIPEAFSEGKMDWEKLKATLGEDINFSNERYVLNWAGKSDAFRVLREPSTQTLIPAKQESIHFDKTENIFIEGENLEVLKILQKSYFRKIKMIYIDPPYNTGNDSFIYPDKFSETKEDYQKRVGDKDENGYMTREGFYQKNSKENGQYHSNWLNMMYPRLFLAKNLLKDDGVIFVSIDDNEVHNLRLIMDEIFGEENFVVDFVWKTRQASGKQVAENNTSSEHEYILCYQKNKVVKFLGVDRDSHSYTNPDNDPRGDWAKHPLDVGSTKDERPNCFYDLIDPETGNIYPANPNRVWAYSQESMKKLLNERKILFDPNGKTKPYLKKFWTELKSEYKPISTWLDKNTFDIGYNTEGTKLLNKIFDGDKIFDYPKPPSILKLLIKQITSNDDIILDFFSGSATTAHAVMQLNSEDGGNRKFIMVQLPEKTNEESEAYQAGYKTIADIAKERIRRVIKKIKEETQGKLDFTPDSNQNLGFKVFKLSDSNFKQWNGQGIKTAKVLEEQMEFFTEPLSQKALNDFIVYELLIEFGFDLNSQIKHQNEVYYINTHEMVLLLEKVSKEILSRIIKTRPQKVVALDALFNGNDELKTNTVLQMKDAGIHFKTI